MITVSLSTSNNVSDANRIIARVNGTWQALGAGASGPVYAVAIGPDRTIYAGGSFVTMDGVTVNRAAYYRNGVWAAMGDGADDYIVGMAIDSLGRLLAVGYFTTMDGDTVNYIARWDPSAGAWDAFGDGANGAVEAIAVDREGRIFIGGQFSSVDSVAATKAAYYDGTWHAMGTGLNGTVTDITVLADGRICYVGVFTTAGGSTVNHIAIWDPVAGSWSGVGSGTSGGTWNYLSAVRQGSDGTIYIAGNFTAAGGVAAESIAGYKPAVGYFPLGSGLTKSGSGAGTAWGYALHYANGALLVGGDFTEAGGFALVDKFGVWTGTGWGNFEIDLPGSAIVGTVAQRDDILVLGYDTAGTAITSGQTTVSVDVGGTNPAYPRFIFKRAGGDSATLEYIENLTTGKVMRFDHDLVDGETLVIDLTPANKRVYREAPGRESNQLNDLLEYSDFSDFVLVPGTNVIKAYVSSSGGPTVSGWLQYTPIYKAIQ